MRVAENWKDYELIDCSGGERLERWGEIFLVRPDPQVIWQTEKKSEMWKNANAVYHRSNSGGGYWETKTKLPDSWQISYENLRFNIKTMGFKHTGLFPEQAVNWNILSKTIKASPSQLRVLNLFSYTGGATVACLKAGAAVTHVDASKGMVSWAKENANASGLSAAPVRWLVDDCIKFVQREIRRGNKYDIIILDPPSYGRGPGGEIWKLEDEIYEFVSLCGRLLNKEAKMMIINSYTAGLSPSVMKYILNSAIVPGFGGSVSCDEIGLPVSETGLVLPCGSSAVWTGLCAPCNICPAM